MKQVIRYLILVPLALVVILFAVANREIVTLSIDPFDAKDPALAVRLPLFAIMFGFTILGILIGGIAAWLRQGKHRRSARALRSELDSLRRKFELHRGPEPHDLPRIETGQARLPDHAPSL